MRLTTLLTSAEDTSLVLRVFVGCSGAVEVIYVYFGSYRYSATTPYVQGQNGNSIYFLRFLSCHNQWVPKEPKFLGGVGGTRGAALQICRILLELLRIYEGSVTGATFLSKTARKVHEKMILKTKENVRSKDPNGINKDSSHHGFVGS